MTSRRGHDAGGRRRHASGEGFLLRKVGSYLSLEADDVEALQGLEQRRTTVDQGRQIIAEGDDYTRIYVLQEGWAIRHKSLEDGRRQIVNFALPGDFLCLNAALFGRSSYAISTVTPAVVSPFDPVEFRNLALSRPLLSMGIAWCNAREEALLAEHLTSVGRRTAYERVAHLLLELWRRLEIVGLAQEREFEMPLTQSDIGDSVGLSLVHVNRTVQRLRSDGLIETRRPTRTMVVTDSGGPYLRGRVQRGLPLFHGGFPQRVCVSRRTLR